MQGKRFGSRVSKLPLLGVAAGILAIGSAAKAVVIFDQVGASPTTTTTGYGAASQVFEASFSTYSIAAIDDFTTIVPYTLTSAEGVFFSNGTAFTASGITSYSVAIYTGAVGTTTATLTGNVANFSVLPAAATLTTLSSGSTDVVLALPGSFVLPAGSYYMGITPNVAYATYGQTYAEQTTLSAGVPLNARQVNPGNGFAQGTNFAAAGATAGAGANLEYRLSGTAVPEPASFAAIAVGGLLLGARRRRHA